MSIFLFLASSGPFYFLNFIARFTLKIYCSENFYYILIASMSITVLLIAIITIICARRKNAVNSHHRRNKRFQPKSGYIQGQKLNRHFAGGVDQNHEDGHDLWVIPSVPACENISPRTGMGMMPMDLNEYHCDNRGSELLLHKPSKFISGDSVLASVSPIQRHHHSQHGWFLLYYIILCSIIYDIIYNHANCHR